MKRSIKYLLFIIVMILPTLVLAQPIDPETALTLAQQFVQQSDNSTLRSHQAALRLAHAQRSEATDEAFDYYVFNSADGRGVVIIAGDNRAKHVLAYGDGSFDIDNAPDNLRWMLDQYAQQIEHLFSHPEILPSEPDIKASSSSTATQLLTTTWGQRSVYRDQCPQVDGMPCVTGYVATSMAQVMNHREFPSILLSLPAYVTQTLNLQVPKLPKTSVSWQNMLDSYKEESYAQTNADAMAKLMRYCGQAVKMDYTIASSGAPIPNQLDALKQFGFAQSAALMQRAEYDDTTWNRMIQEDLFAGFPVIYSGKDASMSHNFILDGFDGSKYHVNWGWDGAYNGYYELDAMNGGVFRPTLGHIMIHGLCPEAETPQCDFAYSGIFYNIIDDHHVEVTYRSNNYTLYGGDVVIPGSIDYYGHTYVVSAIGEKTFMFCSELKSVLIPNTVTNIGKSAFARSSIKSIFIPDAVITI